MLTRSQINRAGRRLRKAETPDEADRQIYDEFRATFAEPLGEVVEILRGLASGAPVTYRLKRFETTVEKLRRLTSDLSRLEDIAGCRVVLPTMREQHELLGKVRRELDVVRERDYQAEPRGGYRALHVVVRCQGKAVEVQLRTELEEQWANAVERLAERLDPEIKYGGGPREAIQLLETVSAAFGSFDALEEIGYSNRAALRGILGARGGTGPVAEELDSSHAALRSAREGVSTLLPLIESAMIDESTQLEQLATLAPAIAHIVEALDSSTHHMEAALAMTESLDA